MARPGTMMTQTPRLPSNPVAPTRLEKERRRRIRLAVAALAYEVFDQPVMPDAEFDQLAREVMPKFRTGHDVLDRFFATEFSPNTGVWVRRHPEQDGLKRILREVYRIPSRGRAKRPAAENPEDLI